MFRRIRSWSNKEAQDDPSPNTETAVEPKVTVSVSTTWGDTGYERTEWVDPRNSNWRDYEDFFFKGKEWYRDTPQWRQVLRVCHAHWNIDRAIGETYYRREIDGVEPTIPLCRELIAIAPQAKVALEMHEKFEYDYRLKEIQKEKAEWKRRGWGEYVGWEPILRPFKLPDHSGFKQLAIIYDKMKDHKSAIEVCQEALAVDWPGDWDVRIARYQRRLDSSSKKAKKKSKTVTGNVVTIDADQGATASRFCTQCGSELEADDLFCSRCGSKR